MKDLFHGKSIHLTAEEPETLGKLISEWNRDSEYTRLLNVDASPLWSARKVKEWVEKDEDKTPPQEIFFTMRTTGEERIIGFVGLWGFSWTHGDCWVSIGVGDRACWGKGYGTEAMQMILAYAFDELNLQRVSLGVFAYNQRAIGAYQKTGFKVEGNLREAIHREGQRADMLMMGILRTEWEAHK